MSEETTTTAPTSVAELTPKMEVKGTVKRLELYGAFVDIGVGHDALLHISQLGKPNVRNVGDDCVDVLAFQALIGSIAHSSSDENLAIEDIVHHAGVLGLGGRV